MKNNVGQPRQYLRDEVLCLSKEWQYIGNLSLGLSCDIVPLYHGVSASEPVIRHLTNIPFSKFSWFLKKFL